MSVSLENVEVFRDYDPWAALLTISEWSIGPGLFVLGIVLVASLFVERPWCRYACPLGAAGGLVSKLSPVFLQRNEAACKACGGLLKTATISFGQAMPEAEMARARRLSKEYDLFVAIGTSLVVHPAAGLPEIARKHGARLVIINREATPLDPVAHLVLRGDIGEILDR